MKCFQDFVAAEINEHQALLHLAVPFRALLCEWEIWYCRVLLPLIGYSWHSSSTWDHRWFSWVALLPVLPQVDTKRAQGNLVQTSRLSSQQSSGTVTAPSSIPWLRGSKQPLLEVLHPALQYPNIPSVHSFKEKLQKITNFSPCSFVSRRPDWIYSDREALVSWHLKTTCKLDEFWSCKHTEKSLKY